MRSLSVLLLWLLCTSLSWSQQIPLPATSVPLNSEKGQELLLQSHDRKGYWNLSDRFETQATLSHCGPASAVMVLNALGVPAPTSKTHPPFKVFQQDNFFTSETDKILTESDLRHRGATLEQLGAMLACHGVETQAYHAEEGGLEEFRRLARQAVDRADQCVIINFLREPLGQVNGGHFSPLGAYSQSSDSFLVMDVARYKYPPFWVKTVDLFRAMQTLDRDSQKNRGYLVVTVPGGNLRP